MKISDLWSKRWRAGERIRAEVNWELASEVPMKVPSRQKQCAQMHHEHASCERQEG